VPKSVDKNETLRPPAKISVLISPTPPIASKAVEDFNRTLEIEPYFTNAYANRAFAIIRKYEFADSRTLSKSGDIQIIATKEVEIPVSLLTKVCDDLNKAVSLGDDNWMALQAVEKHCKE
jgi:hypothetical protein